jgi:hypothetical protein
MKSPQNTNVNKQHAEKFRRTPPRKHCLKALVQKKTAPPEGMAARRYPQQTQPIHKALVMMRG